MDFKDIWIIQECANPSTEYYILPALKIAGLEERIRILNIPPENKLRENINLIFVRYITREWINFVESNKNKIKKIIYFMDDDLFDLRSWRGLPLRYIKKIYLKAFQWKRWFTKVNVEFFVSTEFLAEKYSKLNPVVLPPYPIFNPLSPEKIIEKESNLTVFYHGTASHIKEIKWLYDIVKKVILLNENIIFELIGNDKVYNKFKTLERVIVVHPMKWNLYKGFLLTKRRHIGLVPLLDNDFNLARSYTKFFEIVSCGAVGIYSKKGPYEKIIHNETEGILVLNEKTHWIENIIKLAEDSSFRLNLYSKSIDKLKTLKEFAEKNYREKIKERLL